MTATFHIGMKGMNMVGRLISVLSVVLGLVTISANPVQAMPRASAPLHQRLLYQTTWQHGKIGWSSSGDGAWQVVDGRLTYDGAGVSAMLAPVSMKGRANFAIEMTVQALDHGDYNGTYGFGILFRAPPHPDLYPHYGAPDALGAGIIKISAVIGGISVYPTALTSSDFDAGQGWHRYRVEIRGTGIRLLVDGQVAAQTRSTRFLTRSSIGLFSIDDGLTVKTFKVFTL